MQINAWDWSFKTELPVYSLVKMQVCFISFITVRKKKKRKKRKRPHSTESSSIPATTKTLNFLFSCIAQKTHHCFFPFLFFLPPVALQLLELPALAEGLSVDTLLASKRPDWIAFCNHSKNSSSVMFWSMLAVGIPPPRCTEDVPFALLCLEVMLVLTWKVGLWALGGHLIPCNGRYMVSQGKRL